MGNSNSNSNSKSGCGCRGGDGGDGDGVNNNPVPAELSLENGGTRRLRRRGHHTRKKWQSAKCSPAVSGKTVHYNTCFTPAVMSQIKDAYNAAHPADKITTDVPADIWRHLKAKFAGCDDEMCWLDKLGNASLKKKIEEQLFAPKSPSSWKHKPNEWLSNIDILAVLKQYETANKHFKFIGPTAIDFDTVLHAGKCVTDDLCNFELQDYISDHKTKIGIIFNLDKHDESGSHWVAMFIDLEHHFLFYFDSACNPVPPEIKKLTARILEQAKAAHTPLHYYDNQHITHQRTNTECGMYCLFFVVTMLTGEIETEQNGHKRTLRLNPAKRRNLFLRKRVPDKYVEKYRKVYFNEA